MMKFSVIKRWWDDEPINIKYDWWIINTYPYPHGSRNIYTIVAGEIEICKEEYLHNLMSLQERKLRNGPVFCQRFFLHFLLSSIYCKNFEFGLMMKLIQKIWRESTFSSDSSLFGTPAQFSRRHTIDERAKQILNLSFGYLVF